MARLANQAVRRTANPNRDATRIFHREWLGLAQPIEGLVFSVPALDEAPVPAIRTELTAALRALTRSAAWRARRAPGDPLCRRAVPTPARLRRHWHARAARVPPGRARVLRARGSSGDQSELRDRTRSLRGRPRRSVRDLRGAQGRTGHGIDGGHWDRALEPVHRAGLGSRRRLPCTPTRSISTRPERPLARGAIHPPPSSSGSFATRTSPSASSRTVGSSASSTRLQARPPRT
jgi:hypothetical protein